MSSIFQDFGSWLQGILFILIIYHTSAYKFTKDKSFLIYAGYLLLSLIYFIPKTNNGFSEHLTTNFFTLFNYLNWIIQIWFWMLYSWFSLHFLEIRKNNAKLANNIIRYIQITTIVSTAFFVFDLLLFEVKYMGKFYLFAFVPISLVLIFGSFLLAIYKFKSIINKFFVFGFIFFLGFSLIALYFSTVPNAFINQFMQPIHFFMIGVLIEASVLSLGLGYKFYMYRKERDEYNQQLIAELQNNHHLKDRLNKELSKELEIQKINEIEIKYLNEINELKLTSLLSQMNPHFIFNALNSIKQYIIANDQKSAVHYLNKFSKFIRKILEASAKKEVTLQEELETMYLYITIENIRFSNEIQFSTQIKEKENLETIKVPSLILQPFLENAIWHGLSAKQGEKKLQISVNKVSEKQVDICIEDNGIGREKAEEIKSQKAIQRKSIGIKLTKKRLAAFARDFKTNYAIKYIDLKDKNNSAIGTKVLLSIPII